jgi:hypothetical protein
MATKIKDSATAERAALKLNEGIEAQVKEGEPVAPREKTTSEKLFPEFTTEDGAITNRPVKPFQDLSKALPVTATPTPELQGQKTPLETPTAPVYLTSEEMAGKMVKLKVDGIEQDVLATEALKTHQLERSLNARMERLAHESMRVEDERQKLADERRRLASQADPQKPSKPDVKKSPEVETMEARLAQMESFLAQQQETLRPAIQEAGIKRVEQMVKSQIGADDFRTYFEKIRDGALEQMANPDVANDPNARRFYDSDGYYFEKYKEMKLRDVLTKQTTPANPNAPALVTSQGAPLVVNNNGVPVSMPAFESSGGVPSRTSPDADWQGTYNALFKRARESGEQGDWMAVYRHKITARE